MTALGSLGLAALLLASCASEETRGGLALRALGPKRWPGECRLVGLANGRTVQLSIRDVLGNPVQIGTPDRSKLTLVVFISRSSKDEAADLLQEIDDKLMDRPIETVAIVDVTKFAGILHRAASRQLRKSAQEARVKRRERREQRGVDASPAAVDRWHLVGDFSGANLDRFGVAREPAHPVAFVVGCSGAMLGPFHDAEALLAAVDQANGAQSARSTRGQ